MRLTSKELSVNIAVAEGFGVHGSVWAGLIPDTTVIIGEAMLSILEHFAVVQKDHL